MKCVVKINLVFLFNYFIFVSFVYSQMTGFVSGKVTPVISGCTVSVVPTSAVNNPRLWSNKKFSKNLQSKIISVGIDSFGNFKIELNPDEYLITAVSDGYEVKIKPTITVVGGNELKNQNLKLVPYGTVIGNIIRESDDDVWIRVRKNVNDQSVNFLTHINDNSGSFKIDHFMNDEQEWNLEILSHKYGIIKFIDPLVTNGAVINGDKRKKIEDLIKEMCNIKSDDNKYPQYLSYYSKSYVAEESGATYAQLEESVKQYSPDLVHSFPTYARPSITFLYVYGTDSTIGVIYRNDSHIFNRETNKLIAVMPDDRVNIFVNENGNWKLIGEKYLYSYDDKSLIQSYTKKDSSWFNSIQVHYVILQDSESVRHIKIKNPNEKVNLGMLNIKDLVDNSIKPPKSEMK